MHIETMIYAYLAICASMIVFNCVCIFVFRTQNTMLHRRSSRLEERILEQICRLGEGAAVEDSHRELLRRKLGWVDHLMAFDETLERMRQQQPETVGQYLRQIAPVFSCLAVENHYHNAMKMSYFAYVVKKYGFLEGRGDGAILDVMMRLLQEPSIYCRENALQAIYSSGDCGCVLRALREVDGSSQFHSERLLTDGLLTFRGDRDQLAATLWNTFDSFSVKMRVVILDFIRFGGGDMCPELLQLLADPHQDDEIRFSCIRYFGKYPYEPAFPLLIAFAKHDTNQRWEYAAIAATALAAYPCQRSIEVLKRALHSSNWYIRFNAAKSLDRFHLSYLELSDVMDGNDRYARESMQYRFDLGNAREEVLV